MLNAATKYIGQVYAMLFGSYVVSKDLRYGQHRQFSRLKRFYSLSRAKDFAKRFAAGFGGRVVVSAGPDFQTLCVYRRK